jgi:signal transduction histidine kinase
MTDVAIGRRDRLVETLPALRRARFAGAITIAVVIVIGVGQQPPPGLTGEGLAVSASLLVLFVAMVGLIRGGYARSSDSRATALVAAMVAGATALVWLQPRGAGMAGLFVAVAFAGMRLGERQSLAALAVAAAVFVPAAVHTHRPEGIIASVELGIVAFYLVARFGRSAAEAHGQTRRLLVELQATRDAEAEAAMLRERSRLARDMHDVLAHSLSGLMLQLEGARMLAVQPDANGQLSPALERAHHLARAGLEEARRAIAALRDEDPPGPDRLQQLVSDFELDSSIPASLTITGAPRKLDSETALTLYRVAQEALTNVRKHALPDRVEIRLSYDTPGTHLTVSDHPAGRPAAKPRTTTVGGGYGLTGMDERARLLGGRLDSGPTATGSASSYGFHHDRGANHRIDRRRPARRPRGADHGAGTDAGRRDRRHRI